MGGRVMPRKALVKRPVHTGAVLRVSVFRKGCYTTHKLLYGRDAFSYYKGRKGRTVAGPTQFTDAPKIHMPESLPCCGAYGTGRWRGICCFASFFPEIRTAFFFFVTRRAIFVYANYLRSCQIQL